MVGGQERMAAFLFDGNDCRVLDVKFLPGNKPNLTADEMCDAALPAMKAAIARDTVLKVFPEGRREQRNISEILAKY